MISATLAWYAVRDLASLSRVRVRFALGDIETGAADPHVFRDAGGGYWWMQDGTHWLVSRDTAWTSAQPPERLEGLNVWSALVPSPPERTGDVDAAPADAAEALLWRVRRVRDGYRAGDIDAETAAVFAQEAYLVLRDGSIWMPGVSTLRWYRFASDAWSEAVAPAGAPLWQPPAAGQSSTADDAVITAVIRFLEVERPLPEPVTAPWDPPPPPAV